MKGYTITVPQIIEELERYGISAERKSIYDDLEALRFDGVAKAIGKNVPAAAE